MVGGSRIRGTERRSKRAENVPSAKALMPMVTKD